MARAIDEMTEMVEADPGGFDVTAVIGRVEYASTGSSAYHAAMNLIADNSIGLQEGSEVTYNFPGVQVTVKNTG